MYDNYSGYESDGSTVWTKWLRIITKVSFFATIAASIALAILIYDNDPNFGRGLFAFIIAASIILLDFIATALIMIRIDMAEDTRIMRQHIMCAISKTDGLAAVSKNKYDIPKHTCNQKCHICNKYYDANMAWCPHCK